jgi:hypothetical protein
MENETNYDGIAVVLGVVLLAVMTISLLESCFDGAIAIVEAAKGVGVP